MKYQQYYAVIGDSHIRIFSHTASSCPLLIYLGSGKQVNFLSVSSSIKTFLKCLFVIILLQLQYPNINIFLSLGEPDIRWRVYKKWKIATSDLNVEFKSEVFVEVTRSLRRLTWCNYLLKVMVGRRFLILPIVSPNPSLQTYITNWNNHLLSLYQSNSYQIERNPYLGIVRYVSRQMYFLCLSCRPGLSKSGEVDYVHCDNKSGEAISINLSSNLGLRLITCDNYPLGLIRIFLRYQSEWHAFRLINAPRQFIKQQFLSSIDMIRHIQW